MEPIVERCCGIDVHKVTVVACLAVGASNQRAKKQTRTFGTTTRELEGLRDWLVEHKCTHVGMESTGVYWMPVYAVLEGHVELIVGNAAHIKNVPGRKTDVKDAEWLAELVRHGLIQRSFVPPPWQRALRDLVRYRRKLIDSETAERNRLQRLLETCNIKLSSVASDVFGASGRAMLRALIAGDVTVEEMACLARGRLRQKRERLILALEGKLQSHHRYLLEMQLDRVEHIEADIARLDERIDAALAPHREVLERLTQIPGVCRVTAMTIIAELGVDMSIFPTDSHAANWAGVCPGNNESAGKRGRAPHHGNVHLSTALVQAAFAASRKRGCYLKERFWRLSARRGPKRAAMAVAHTILKIAYHMLATGEDYRELGTEYFDRVARRGAERRLVKRLEAMGYIVSKGPQAEEPPRAILGV